jgi:hypothetical protein
MYWQSLHTSPPPKGGGFNRNNKLLLFFCICIVAFSDSHAQPSVHQAAYFNSSSSFPGIVTNYMEMYSGFANDRDRTFEAWVKRDNVDAAVHTSFMHLTRLIKLVVESEAKAIQEHFKQYPDKDFKRIGRRAIYFDGHYYRVDIDKEGKLVAFHPYNNNDDIDRDIE